MTTDIENTDILQYIPTTSFIELHKYHHHFHHNHQNHHFMSLYNNTIGMYEKIYKPGDEFVFVFIFLLGIYLFNAFCISNKIEKSIAYTQTNYDNKTKSTTTDEKEPLKVTYSKFTV